MKPLRFSIFVFLNASFLSLTPVALLVLLPNSWWGISIKVISALWSLSVIGSLLKFVSANQTVYGGSSPGFVINMPLFATVLFLNPGTFKFVAVFGFLFIALANFLMIYNNAKTNLGSDKSRSE